MGFHDMPRPPRIVALGGPVTAAIRAMRADEPATDYARIRELRRAIADRIEADIALLDALDGDADIEQDAGELPESETFNRNLDDEPSLGSLYGTAEGAHLGQGGWADGGSYDLEESADDLPQHDDDFEHDSRNLPAVVIRYGAPSVSR